MSPLPTFPAPAASSGSGINPLDWESAALLFAQQYAPVSKRVIAIDYNGATSYFTGLAVGTGTFGATSSVGAGLAVQSGANGTETIVPFNQPNITGGSGAAFAFAGRALLPAGLSASAAAYPIQGLLYNSFPGNVPQAGFRFGFRAAGSLTNLVFHILSGATVQEEIVTDELYANRQTWLDWMIISDGARTAPFIGNVLDGTMRQPLIVSSTGLVEAPPAGAPVELLCDNAGFWANSAALLPAQGLGGINEPALSTDLLYGWTEVPRH